MDVTNLLNCGNGLFSAQKKTSKKSNIRPFLQHPFVLIKTEAYLIVIYVKKQSLNYIYFYLNYFRWYQLLDNVANTFLQNQIMTVGRVCSSIMDIITTLTVFKTLKVS